MIQRADPVEFGTKTRNLRAIYDIGGIVGVVRFLEDMPEDEVRVLTAYLIGYLQETT
jgi:hypothetical protein